MYSKFEISLMVNSYSFVIMLFAFLNIFGRLYMEELDE